MQTESWKARDVLKLQEDIMQGRTCNPTPECDNSPIILEEASPRVSRVAHPCPTTPTRAPSIKKDSSFGKSPTKSQNQRELRRTYH